MIHLHLKKHMGPGGTRIHHRLNTRLSGLDTWLYTRNRLIWGGNEKTLGIQDSRPSTIHIRLLGFHNSSLIVFNFLTLQISSWMILYSFFSQHRVRVNNYRTKTRGRWRIASQIDGRRIFNRIIRQCQVFFEIHNSGRVRGYRPMP